MTVEQSSTSNHRKPEMLSFYLDIIGKDSGCIWWMERPGFKSDSVWEIIILEYSKLCKQEQVVFLIQESLRQLKEQLGQYNLSVRTVWAWTHPDERFPDIWKEALGAKTSFTQYFGDGEERQLVIVHLDEN